MSDSQYFADAARAASEASEHQVSLVDWHRHNPSLVAARFRLDNGLTVVFVPDRRAPVFTYQTWFRVGSRDEDPNRTGLAHLFEHLMFKATENHPLGEFDRDMERRGAQTNAATWVDWTYYVQSLASRDDNFETVVDYEVDRMAGLILDEDTFRSELEVVKNERRMTVEDSVGGTMNEVLLGMAYTKHSYRWPTIGYMEHLEASTVDDLKAFYRQFYAPNNASVIVCGDLDLVNVLTTIARRYGPMERQTIERVPREAEPRQQGARIKVLERPLQATQVIVGYPSPPQSDPDFPALEIINDALCVGESGRLYQRLVIDEELVTDIDGFVSPFSEPGLFEFFASVRPGVDHERVVDVLQEELDKVAEGLSDREFSKARNNLEVSIAEAFKDSESCADSLGHFETNYGDYRVAFEAMDRFSKVTPEGLQRVAREVLRADNRNTVVAVPA